MNNLNTETTGYMLRKNTVVKYNGRNGVVMGNSYVHYEGVNKNGYVEVLFDGDEYISNMKVELLEMV